MDMFSYYFDPLPNLSDFCSPEVSESSCVSDSGSGRRWNFSDEEVLLASNHPKKSAGRKKFRETRHPVYRGVRRRNSNKWVCEVRVPNKKSRIWLGTFPTAEMAARAHDVAAMALKGRLACLNFADSAWRLPIPDTSDPKDIQKAAAEAAEAFRPNECEEYEEEAPIGDHQDEETSQSSTALMPENLFCMDDELVFGMPGLLSDMANGMMLTPPECIVDGHCGDAIEALENMSLWSYSY
uniref:Transcription factor ERF44 n=1 Tax=Nothapodytes nimmoniana TaxID=159386 RepID=A0A9E8Z0A6_NOTNI|nr:transcription factor ERF44 [Nothapodytes nimmoniana]